MQLELNSRYEAVVRFITEASDAAVPVPLQVHLFRFGTVLICGYIERCIEIIIMSRLSKKAQGQVLSFIKSYFAYGRNLDCNAVLQLLVRFDSDWYKAFEKSVQGDAQMKEGVSSCYALRNAVAHGNTPGVTLSRLQQLLAAAKQMVDYVVVATK